MMNSAKRIAFFFWCRLQQRNTIRWLCSVAAQALPQGVHRLINREGCCFLGRRIILECRKELAHHRLHCGAQVRVFEVMSARSYGSARKS